MNLGPILMSVLPSVGLALIFWYVMRAVIRADRRERAELAKIDAEEARRAAAESAENGSNSPLAN
ncbi:hypothetical protein [Demequina sp.]|uniref:hypothetical protein n=1 Tax=Demequina sp. TaxID=2050685 RepID=UPI003D1075AD